jgi:methionine-rich copper-binding protein CopC
MRFRQIIALVGAIFLLFTASPASAHTVMVNSIPQSKSVISSLPTEVTITFAEDIITIGDSNSIKVFDPANYDVSQGQVLVAGQTLSKSLKTSDKDGEYRVEYRAVAADGHVIKGEFTFTVAATGVTTSEFKSDPIKNLPNSSSSKLSVYLILSVTAIVGGLLILVFIWKKQAK